jgi:hypothetical protein
LFIVFKLYFTIELWQSLLFFQHVELEIDIQQQCHLHFEFHISLKSHLHWLVHCLQPTNSSMSDDDTVANELLERSREFAASVCEFPTANNRLENLLINGRTSHAEIAAHARSVCIGVHHRVVPVMRAFLQWKSNDESTPMSARALFASLSVNEFAVRLITQRPLAFLTSFDHAKLRQSGGSALDRNAFTHIGTATEAPPLNLAQYISYHEIILAALLIVSSYTLFINSGDRGNCARLSSSPFVPRGVYIGAVGARFERDDQMETLFIIVNRDRCTEANGYGPGLTSPLLAVLAPLYGVTHFPTWSEAATEYEARKSDAECRYSRVGNELFDRLAFRARIRVTLETVLLDAERRGVDSGRSAFVYLVGLGLGVWAVTRREQCALFLDELALAIAQLSLAHIGDVYIAWFPPETQRCGTARDGETLLDAQGHAVTIRFGNANPADPMPNSDSLLVATFAWDGNSYPGNEYWLGSLAASGDPAAACCSTIPEIQNPWINSNINTTHVVVLGERE